MTVTAPAATPLRIDAHQHFWDYSKHAADYVWMGANDGVLKRNFMPADLVPLLDQAGLHGSIAVQARELPEETRFLLDLAADHSRILGVVGWLDLCAPDIESTIEVHATDKKLRGLRMLIHDRADPNFADSPAHLRGVSLLDRHGLTYDLLLRPEHLAAATRLVDALPQQRFVIDHIAKPRISERPDPGWTKAIREIAGRSNVWCKISGLSTLQKSDLLSATSLHCTLNSVLDVFGARRCMVGSDWPVCLLGASYADTAAITLDWASTLSTDERDALFGQTCVDFYKLNGVFP